VREIMKRTGLQTFGRVDHFLDAFAKSHGSSPLCCLCVMLPRRPEPILRRAVRFPSGVVSSFEENFMKLPPRLAVLLLIFLLASMPGLIGQAPPSAGGAPEPAAALVRNGPTVHAVSINFDSGKILEPARMVSDGDFHRQPDWSFDGKYLSYVNNNPQQRRSIKILSMDSGEVREIVPTMDFFEWPRWSPDGRSFIIHDGT
jgi:hypothetical protein